MESSNKTILSFRPANNAERLKIEEPLEGENSDQLQVVNKIKELLNNKIQESSSDGVNIDVSDLLATTELAEADTTLSPDVRVADLATTTTTTTTTTTETTTTTTTTTQPPPPPSPPAEEPQQPAADPGIFGRITQLLNSLNPFGGNFGFQPVVIG